MSRTGCKFSVFTKFYLLVAIVAWCGAPLWLLLAESAQDDVDIRAFYIAGISCVLVVGLLLFASSRCSSEKLEFKEGLLFITQFMQTGWSFSSLAAILVALPVALLASIAIALHSLLPSTGAPGGPEEFGRLVRFFYRNRMIQ